MRLRYIETGFNPAAFNMGLDEAILDAVAAGIQEPTLRLYGWKPRAVSIGYFQGLNDEVDIQACAERNVDVVRRVTGGGAVFHADELTYSILLPESHPLIEGTILDSYRSLCGGVVEGLCSLGIHAEFAPLNDIVADGRKLSGNAQTRRNGCLLQHGTILLSVDVDEMFAVLLVPNEKMKGRLIQDVKARVGSVSAMLGRAFGFGEAIAVFRAGFSRALGADLEPASPSAGELESARRLAESKFGAPGWTGKR
ncbi:MAG: lipoate--protein ligase family protein [Spirochaetales bacterium]|nr:MAG: lipoate--protein ligase family protein [Spirochaetales bacterium]